MKAKEQLEYQIKSSGLSKREWYRKIYLYSEHWEQLRREKFKVSGEFCVNCDRTSNLQVHHKRYRSIYNVTVDDLEVLCSKCHKSEHAFLKEERRRKRALKPRKVRRNELANQQRAIAKSKKNQLFNVPMPNKNKALVSEQHNYWMWVTNMRCNQGDFPPMERMVEELRYVIGRWGCKMSPLARKALKDTRRALQYGLNNPHECEDEAVEDVWIPELDNRLNQILH